MGVFINSIHFLTSASHSQSSTFNVDSISVLVNVLTGLIYEHTLYFIHLFILTKIQRSFSSLAGTLVWQLDQTVYNKWVLETILDLPDFL